jgi:hypothetical protein
MTPQTVLPTPGIRERRRHARLPASDLTLTLPIVRDAEVLDLSSSGALVSIPEPISRGQRLKLRMLLGREPFQAWVEVKRVEKGTITGRPNRVRAGVEFTSFDEHAQQTLQRFLRERAPGAN